MTDNTMNQIEELDKKLNNILADDKNFKSSSKQNHNFQNNNHGPNKKNRKEFTRNFKKNSNQNPNRQHIDVEPKINIIPKIQPNILRIIPIGGVEEVGKNCTVLEYGNDIIVVDMGLMFPHEGILGVQYIIPDYSYLEQNADRIRGIVITHAHLDHIGAIPYIMQAIDKKIPIYGTDITLKIIEKRQMEFGSELSLRKIKAKETIKLGCFSIEFIHVNHTVPGSLGACINTPIGNIVTLGDWKIDHSPIGDEVADLGHIVNIGKRKVLAYLGDSTNAYLEGFQKSETEVMRTLDTVYKESKGRIIVGTFASSISRIQQVITLAERHHRKVFFAGYSMRVNTQIAKDLKYLKYSDNTIIDAKKLHAIADNQVVIACTGAQGEENAALGKIAADKHKDIYIKKGDNVIFSSSVIPGNEQSIQVLLDKIYKKGGKVISIKEMAVHSGGHAKSEEVKIMYNLLRPYYYITIHGNYYLLAKHKELIESLGHNPERIIIPENGSILEFNKNGNLKILNEKISNKTVAIDGLGVGDLPTVVLNDRKIMANSGIFIIVLTVNKNSKDIIIEPEVISRGFVYLKTSEKLINDTKQIVNDVYTNNKTLNLNDLKNRIRNEVSSFLYKQTEREPMVIPLIIMV